jgi:hypothetical protein
MLAGRAPRRAARPAVKKKSRPAVDRRAEAGPAAPAPAVVRCRGCGAALTAALAPWPEPRPPGLDGTADVVPPGFFWQAPAGAEVWPGAEPAPLVVNRRDVAGLVPAGDRTGCCGPGGTNGPNLACRCGRLVATEVADCFTPHMALFGPRAAAGAPSGVEGPAARVLTVGGGEPLRSREAFAAWAHGALGAAAWHGDDVESLVRDWLARTTDGETVCVVWLNADASARAGVPLRAIEAAVASAHGDAPGRRLALVFL